MCYTIMFCDEIFATQPASKFCEEEERWEEWEGGDSEGKKHKTQDGNGLSGNALNSFVSNFFGPCPNSPKNL